MFCQQCGAAVEPNAPFCPSCGKPQPTEGVESAPAPAELSAPRAVQVRTGDWIGQGWQLVKADMVNFILMSLVLLALNAVLPLILQGALNAGMYMVCMKKLAGKRTEFGDLFKGFNFFVPTLVASLLIALFVSGGFLLCIIPGLVLSAMYQFTYLFIVDRKMEFWPAMQASHAIVKNDYFGFTLFLLAVGLIHVLGVLCCLVGLLVTIPIQFVAVTAAYRDLVGFSPSSLE